MSLTIGQPSKGGVAPATAMVPGVGACPILHDKRTFRARCLTCGKSLGYYEHAGAGIYGECVRAGGRHRFTTTGAWTPTTTCILAEDTQFLSAPTTQAATWFHASWRAVMKARQAPRQLHVGTPLTALARRNAESRRGFRAYIHAYKLVGPVDDDWTVDDGAPGSSSGLIRRYINLYEGVGTVSLVGDFPLFECVDTLELPTDEYFVSPSDVPKHVRAWFRKHGGY